MSLKIEYFPLGPLGENTYLVTDEASGLKAVIDPGYFGPEITELIGNKENLRYILLTHGHHDHFAAAQDYRNAYPDAVFAAPRKETYLMYKGRDNGAFSMGDGRAVCPQADLLVEEGDMISIGESELSVIETPGHTEGSVCYLGDKYLFCGDLLFRLSVGRTDLETGDWKTLVRSIEDKIYTLDENIVVLSGHGPATTIGYEKKANPFV